jgi:hypothetical protein
MIAASGTIRIPTRRRPLTRYHNLTKIQASTQACQHNKMTTPPTHRRANTGKGCRRQARPVRHRRRTVPSLHGVAVSSQTNPYSHRLTSTHISLLSRHGRARGPAAGPRHDLAVIEHRTGLVFRPQSPPRPFIYTKHAWQFTVLRRQFQISSNHFVSRPVMPSGGPGALVTSPQDLLITVRTVITTVRLRSGSPGRTAAWGRLSQ